MSYSANPSIVRDGLVYCVDAANERSYAFKENLNPWSTYDAVQWVLPNGNATLTTGIDAPDGSNTAVRLTCSNAGDTLFRINHPTIAVSGTNAYTVSFYVRLISGTSSASGQLVSDWSDGGPSFDYRTWLLTNAWVRVYITSTPAAGNKTFLDLLNNNTNNYVMDYWGVQIERSPAVTEYTPTIGGVSPGTAITRGTSWNDMISGTGSVGPVSNSIFDSVRGGAFGFTGASTSFITTNTYAPLNLTNNMSMEAWVRVDAWTSIGGIMTFGTDAAEQYALWTNTGGIFVASYNWPGTWYQTWSVAQGGATGNWFHVVATFTDGVLRIYVNGVLSNVSSNTLTTFPTVSGAYLTIGNNHPGGDEMFNGRVAIARIYNIPLTPLQVNQNFAAHRGRFGI